MTTPKNLQEFINSYKYISGQEKETIKETAQEILRVAEEFCKEKTINHENQVVKRGSMSATHLIQFLNNYITSASVSEEKKDGK